MYWLEGPHAVTVQWLYCSLVVLIPVFLLILLPRNFLLASLCILLTLLSSKLGEVSMSLTG